MKNLFLGCSGHNESVVVIQESYPITVMDRVLGLQEVAAPGISR
jgi:adenosine/AMP kinase